MPKKLIPEVSQNSLLVSCSWRGASVEAVEAEVTAVLEGTLNRIKGVKSLKSYSNPGNSSLSIEFVKSVDMDLARYEVAGVIRNLYPKFPNGVSYPQVYMKGSRGQNPFMTYTVLTALDGKSLEQGVENEFLPGLAELEGIEEAKIYGIPLQEWRVSIKADEAKSLGISLNDINNAFRENKRIEELGIINFNESRIPVKLSSALAAEEEFGNIPLLKKGGRIVYLEELATFTLVDREPTNYYRLNGYETLNLILIPTDDADQVKLSDKVKKYIAQSDLVKSKNVQFILEKDDSQFIEEEVHTMGSRAVLTLLILFVFVAFTTRSSRYVLIVALSIAANISMAFLVYFMLGISLHLYSFAGIAVSLGIIIDNTIVMLDHLRHKKNKKVFVALLASTLTTIGSLSVIFFLSDRLRLNMMDFALVVVVNLATSLLVALYLIPALLQKLPLDKKIKRPLHYYRRKRRVIHWTRAYEKILVFCSKKKWLFIAIAVLGFGVPVFWLPETLGDDKEEETFLQSVYNKSLGSEFYTSALKEPVEYIFGGSLRLFLQEVNHGQYFTEEKQRTTVVMESQMPVGATLQQMNEVFLKIESYLSQFKEIDKFESRISGPTRASLHITFKEPFEYTSFPYRLKDLLTQKAISLGSADSQVYGTGPAFDNSLRDRLGSFQVELYGYNYDQLIAYAEELKARLLPNPRIKEINLVGQRTSYRKNNYEYVLRDDPERLMLTGDRLNNMFYVLAGAANGEVGLGEIKREGELYSAVLAFEGVKAVDIWGLKNNPVPTRSGMQKLHSVANMGKEKFPEVIARVDQQYFILLEYDFIGSNQLGHMHLNKVLEDFAPMLPTGYSLKQNRQSLTKEEEKEQVWLIGLVIAIIYVICAVLLESLLQPLWIILMIPLSFIGVFLTFYISELSFDQGGYASFILLSGLTVNAALYIINDYNNLLKTDNYGRQQQKKLRIYLKAFNAKIIPVILAILSTVLGLLPYLFAGQKASFWFPLAAGTTGGLLFSLVAIYLYLPLFLLKKSKTEHEIQL